MLCGSSLNKEIEIQEKLFVEIYFCTKRTPFDFFCFVIHSVNTFISNIIVTPKFYLLN